MEQIDIKLLHPKECTQPQLDDFYKLVLLGKQVTAIGLEDRIAASDTLAFAFSGEHLAGVSAMKRQDEIILPRYF